MLEKGHGGLCKAPTKEERRRRKASRRSCYNTGSMKNFTGARTRPSATVVIICKRRKHLGKHQLKTIDLTLLIEMTKPMRLLREKTNDRIKATLSLT